MRLLNMVTMPYLRTVLNNIKAKTIHTIDKKGVVTSPNGDTDLQSMIDKIPYIDDATPSADRTYSSTKIDEKITEINNKIDVLNGIAESLKTI